MILKKEGQNLESNFFKKILLSILFVVFFLNILSISGGILFIKHSPQTAGKIYAILDNYGLSNVKYLPEILSYKIKSIFQKKEYLNINIKHIDLQKIEFMRQSALKGDKNFEYVSAKIVHNGSTYNADLRLKGDREIHYSNLEKASYRVKVKKQNTLFGMNKFSLQKPRVRNYIEEWIFLEMMRDEGIVTPRYNFVNVSINGANRGVYALEEHYTKYLIENNRNKDGPILKFDEFTGNFMLDTINVLELDKWKTEENLPKLKTALALLDGFRNKKLTIDQVFDTKKLAKFFALSDLNYAWHGVITKSMRFYYNPVSMKIEPIPFDGHRGASNKPYLLSAELGIVSENNWTHSKFGNWFRVFFNDASSYSPDFYEEYIQTLERISNKQYLDSFFKEHDKEISDILTLIYSELPLYDNIFSFGPFPYYFNRNSYYLTQKNILNKLKTSNFTANFKSTSTNTLVLEIINKNRSLPIIIDGISDKKDNLLCKPFEHLIIFPVYRTNNHTEIKKSKFKCDNNAITELSENIQIVARYPGSVNRFHFDIMPRVVDDLTVVKNDIIRARPNIENFDFFEIDKESKKITLRKGNYVISNNMIIPAGYTFIIEGGTTVNLHNNAIILSYSKLNWTGLKNERILITSNAGNSGSVVVMNAPKISYIKNVDFSGLSYPQLEDWNISGSINFYNSNVDLNNVKISSNVSEDGLNIVKSKFNINNINFSNIKSDALDIDFGEGNLLNSTFDNIGNDAIDTSGTILYLKDINIFNVGDKAISAGEVSSLNGENVDIKNSEIGVTSKDGSSVLFSRVNIANSKIGLTVFMKKNEYDVPYLKIDQLTFTNNEINHVIEINLKSRINGNEVVGLVKNVDKMLYGNLYGKKSQKIEINGN